MNIHSSREKVDEGHNCINKKNFWSGGAASLELQFSCKKEVMLFMDINEMSKNKWSEG
jgi:hypothetical protein